MNTPRFLLPFEQGLLDMPTGDVLIMGASDSLGLDTFPPTLMLEQGFKPLVAAFETSGYSVTPRATQRFTLTVVNLTRNKIESLGNIARAARLTDGPVLVNGAKTDGIESVLKQVKAKVNIDGVISKSHGKVFWFGAALLPEWEANAQECVNSAGFFTAPGMFSSAKVDAGSQMLMDNISGLKGRGADLGAGWGAIAKSVLSQAEITSVDLFEADFHALEAARKNLDDPRAAFHWADVLTVPKPSDPYDFAVCNPPFHQSRKADPEIGKGFIKKAAQMLKPAGKFIMVANRQLPYETTLDLYFKHWVVLAQNGQFKVIEASRPKNGVQ